MALMILARHAQASFGSANYDKLSELGHQQARWLGDYLRQRELTFKAVHCGTLVRQQETTQNILDAMGTPEQKVVLDAGLNEYNGEAIFGAHEGGTLQIDAQNHDYRDYWRRFRKAVEAWTNDELSDVPETWNQFGQRVHGALSAACANSQRDDVILVVSSGGAISRAICDFLAAPAATAIELNLQMRNAAFCELIVGSKATRVLSYNSLPHLDTPARRGSITSA